MCFFQKKYECRVCHKKFIYQPEVNHFGNQKICQKCLQKKLDNNLNFINSIFS